MILGNVKFIANLTYLVAVKSPLHSQSKCVLECVNVGYEGRSVMLYAGVQFLVCQGIDEVIAMGRGYTLENLCYVILFLRRGHVNI